jgi:hypothetical protein
LDRGWQGIRRVHSLVQICTVLQLVSNPPTPPPPPLTTKNNKKRCSKRLKWCNRGSWLPIFILCMPKNVPGQGQEEEGVNLRVNSSSQ